jgi:hypothetical protein
MNGEESSPKMWAIECAKEVVCWSVVLVKVSGYTDRSMDLVRVPEYKAGVWVLVLVWRISYIVNTTDHGLVLVDVQFCENAVHCGEGAARYGEDHPGGCGLGLWLGFGGHCEQVVQGDCIEIDEGICCTMGELLEI